MMGQLTCKRCGAPLLEDDGFCGSCGTPVEGDRSDVARGQTQAQGAFAGAPATPAAPLVAPAPPPAASQPAAGWYEAPDGSGREQFWDGRRWTKRFVGTNTDAPKAHRLLHFARVLSLIAAWLTLIGGVIGVIVEIAADAELGGGSGSGVFALIVGIQIVSLVVSCVLLFSYPLLIRVALGAEDTARRALDLLAE